MCLLCHWISYIYDRHKNSTYFHCCSSFNCIIGCRFPSSILCCTDILLVVFYVLQMLSTTDTVPSWRKLKYWIRKILQLLKNYLNYSLFISLHMLLQLRFSYLENWSLSLTNRWKVHTTVKQLLRFQERLQKRHSKR